MEYLNHIKWKYSLYLDVLAIYSIKEKKHGIKSINPFREERLTRLKYSKDSKKDKESTTTENLTPKKINT